MPEKAEPIARFCDRWWVVVGDASTVLDGELPPAWGLLALRGRTLVTVKEAPKRDVVAPLERGFVAALLRRATEQFAEMTPNDELAARIEELATARANAMHADPEIANLRRRAEQLDAIEASLGVKLYGHHQLAELGAAYKLLHAAHGTKWEIQQIERAAESAAAIAKSLRAAVRDVKPLLEVRKDDVA
jgi:hypothetical protein